MLTRLLKQRYAVYTRFRGLRAVQTTSIVVQKQNTGSNSSFAKAPRPIPLGDTKEQKRVAEMIQRVDEQNTPPPGLTPEELEKFYDAAKDENDSLKPFPNNINSKTGEVNGPRGPEPTRFGDWERKGRVSDF